MTQPVAIPLWLFVLILLFAAVTFASHFLFPSVRWFLRRRAERIVAHLNERLDRPIQPFKLLRRTDMIQRLIYDPEVMKAVAAQARALLAAGSFTGALLRDTGQVGDAIAVTGPDGAVQSWLAPSMLGLLPWPSPGPCLWVNLMTCHLPAGACHVSRPS